MTKPVNAAAEDAPAKLNLALHIVGRRPDGYHLLESFSVFTTFGDTLSAASADADAFTIHGPMAAGLTTGPDNLVLRARDALRALFPHLAKPVAIALGKHIPVMSGVGGGSSDAAATLRALSRLWRLPLDEAALARIGLTLGADVPMCIAARPLVARGIGEHIEEAGAFPPLPLVLVNPGVGVSTPAIFARLRLCDHPPLPPLPIHHEARALAGWLRLTRNDLLAPALELAPVIGDATEALRANGALFARMSGSGSTCFGLFSSEGAAEAAAAAIKSAQPAWLCVATRMRI